MSHPQPKLPTADTLIRLHSKARVLYAAPANPLFGRQALSDAHARAQVSAYR